MKKNSLGKSKLEVTDLCLGTMTFGAESDEQASREMLDAFVEAGGNFIDTADVYSAGESERIIGRWLSQKPSLRDSLVIATKARFPVGESAESGLSANYLQKAIDANLQRLQIETIDLFQIHAWDPKVAAEEWFEVIKKSVDAGKIRFFGVSNLLGWQLQKAIDIAEANSFPRIQTLQPQYSLLAREIEFELTDVCSDNDISILPWGPLGGGWLSGKYKQDQLPQGESRLGENPKRGVEAFDKRNTPRTFQIIAQLESIAQQRGVTVAEVAIAWLRRKKLVGSVILGARNSSQLVSNLGSASIDLTDSEMEFLDAVSEPSIPDYPYGMVDQVGGR